MNDPVKVLIAEDDYLVSREITRLLKEAGYIVAGEAATGKEALAMVKEKAPDVVIMDIQMPEMDGLEATRQIQEQCPVPVIILSAHETMELVDLAGRAGAAAYLTKPPKSAEIDRAITIAMARHDDLVELRRLNRELEKALDDIKILQGILPICAHCKKIRDEEGVWNQLEDYIYAHSEAQFSHGICPECMDTYYSEYKNKNGNKKEEG